MISITQWEVTSPKGARPTLLSRFVQSSLRSSRAHFAKYSAVC